MRVLITGGGKSGKSKYALTLAEELWPKREGAEKRYFLATGTPFDDEMKERIRIHKEDRDSSFITIEEPINIHKPLKNRCILDDITVWISNLIYHTRDGEMEEILKGLMNRMNGDIEDIILVTNETGMGNIPMDPQVRRYNRLLGLANGMLASAVDRVYLMVSGIPLMVKGEQ